MSVQRYVEGEVVDVRIGRGRVLEFDDKTKSLTIALPAGTDGRYREVHVFVDMPTVSVTRVAPPQWPPVPGDVWRSAPQPGHPDGLLLMYQRYTDTWHRPQERFVPADETGAYRVCSAGQALCELGPLTLVYRDSRPVGDVDEASAAGDIAVEAGDVG